MGSYCKSLCGRRESFNGICTVRQFRYGKDSVVGEGEEGRNEGVITLMELPLVRVGCCC